MIFATNKGFFGDVLTVLKNPFRAYGQWKWEKEWEKRRAREQANEQLEFGMLLAQTPHIVSVDKISERQFYDSDWRVVFIEGSDTKAVVIVRSDGQERIPLLELLSKAKTTKEIKALDERSSIYYD